jgi:quercetin dioxygenase-like cupin family protein
MRRVTLEGEREASASGTLGARVRRLAAEAHVVVIEIAPGGVVGRHPAAVPQLFAVLRGAGWVSGADGERTPVRAGEAVVWEAGEQHESGSEQGMAALIVEAEVLDA